MSSFGSKIIVLLAGLSLAGCMQATSTSYEKSPEASLKPRDKELLAKARYEKVEVAAPFRRRYIPFIFHFRLLEDRSAGAAGAGLEVGIGAAG